MKGYPRWFLATLVGTLLVILASGLLLAPTTLMTRADVDVAWRLPAAARVTMAALHTAAGLATMLLIGALWSVHMRSGWRRRKHRASGLTLALALLMLGASAVALFYAADDTLGALAALVHLAVGLGLIGQFCWHWARGRRSHRQSACRAGSRHVVPGEGPIR
ncbi:MAG: hypothetical protein V4631_13340 [Pseudomonadota bacterium]